MITHTITNNASFTRRRGKFSWGMMALTIVLFANVTGSHAQRVYGVASRTTVVSNGRTTVVHKTTVATGGVHAVGLPSGYIAVLPGGYRVVGGGIYMVGSVRYRATFYQGRTVYIRL
jgi:hypothetical protein